MTKEDIVAILNHVVERQQKFGAEQAFKWANVGQAKKLRAAKYPSAVAGQRWVGKSRRKASANEREPTAEDWMADDHAEISSSGNSEHSSLEHEAGAASRDSEVDVLREVGLRR